MRRTLGRVSLGLVMAGAVAGCSNAPGVPFGVRATEIVWCADADGVVDTVTWRGHDGSLTELDLKVIALDVGAVAEADLLDACARRLRWPTRTTLCEAYAEWPDAGATMALVSARHGEPGPDRPGFPVVVRGRVACEDVTLQAGPAAALAEANDLPVVNRLRVWQATQRLNDWRTREGVWREAADGGCLDIAAAREHALTAQAELDGDWPVLETARDPEDPSHAGLCLDVRLQREGFIEVGYHAVETPHGRSGPVESVTDRAEDEGPSAGR